SVDSAHSNPATRHGEPYPYEGKKNPFNKQLRNWSNWKNLKANKAQDDASLREFEPGFRAGTTTIEAADQGGWVVSIVPSGGWIPGFFSRATRGGRRQRVERFCLGEAEDPVHV